MSGSTKFGSWDANTDGRSSGKTCSPQELHTALDELWTFSANLHSDAFHQAPELEDVLVEAPEEHLNRLRAAGMWWKLQQQLPGRRQAGQRWVDHFTSALVEKLGFARCVSAPQFFWNPDRQVGTEVHMDDVHGFGPDPQVEKFNGAPDVEVHAVLCVVESVEPCITCVNCVAPAPRVRHVW